MNMRACEMAYAVARVLINLRVSVSFVGTHHVFVISDVTGRKN